MNGYAITLICAAVIILLSLALWIYEVRHAEWDEPDPDRLVWLDCHGICGRTHAPHYRHDSGHTTCNGCGSPHPTSARIPRQREASHGS